jgi:alpha-galactosidase
MEAVGLGDRNLSWVFVGAFGAAALGGLAASCSAAGDDGASDEHPPNAEDGGDAPAYNDVGGTMDDGASRGDASESAEVAVERDSSTPTGVDATDRDSSARDGSADHDSLDAPLDAGDAQPNVGGDSAPPGAVAATPPVGWNSWNAFQCNISESLIKATADAMVSSGMQAAGFEYVNIDDCWMDGRDGGGHLKWDASKFPSGIPALADYVHGKGLKLGIYETPNTVTCVEIYGGISPSVAVGSLGHEADDATTFASWGIDYLKYDLCEGQLSSFVVMRDALRATGRAIVYSINPSNGSGCPPTGATTSTCGLDLPGTANLWRIASDINASWASITGLIDQDAPLSPYAGPGHWNDPDMLEVGNGGLTDDENRSHVTMWAMLAAPLLAGNDLRSMSTTVTTILTNAEVLGVDQDPLGSQATLAATPLSGLQVWSKPLSGTNVRAVALLNRSDSAASISFSFTQIGLSNGPASVRDLWQHTELGTYSGSYTVMNVPSHGVALLRIAQ